MMKPTEFSPLIAFDDESPSFVHGFEAGMIWQRMEQAEDVIETDTPLHTANHEVFARMANAAGYEMEVKFCSGDLSEWMEVTFTLRRPGKSHLRLVSED